MTCGSIWLTRDVDAVPLDRGAGTLWVYADKWAPPAAERRMAATPFLRDPWESVADIDLLVVVGLTDIVTPANRVRTGPFLTEPWRGPQRESVDRCLFVGEPWRAWWHWGCVGAEWDDVPHSFAMEGRWNQSMEGRRSNPCTLEEVLRVGRGIVRAHASAPRFGGLTVNVRKVNDDVRAGYAREKELAFQEETTWKGLVKRLGAFAQEACAERSVPSRTALFKALGDLVCPSITVTDLPVDALIAGWYRETVALVDGVAAGCAEGAWTR